MASSPPLNRFVTAPLGRINESRSSLLNKLYWATARLVFFFFISISLLSLGLVVLPLGPLYSWYFCGDWRFHRYYRYTFRVVRQGGRVIASWLFNPAYPRSLFPSLTPPPRMAPDLSRIRLAKGWSGSVKSCDGCMKCCLVWDCPFLDKTRNRCLSYGSFFWRYFNCGRFPENAEQIRYYGCPKWIAADEEVSFTTPGPSLPSETGCHPSAESLNPIPSKQAPHLPQSHVSP